MGRDIAVNGNKYPSAQLVTPMMSHSGILEERTLAIVVYMYLTAAEPSSALIYDYIPKLITFMAYFIPKLISRYSPVMHPDIQRVDTALRTE